MGILCYNSLPKEDFPNVTVPTIYINTIKWRKLSDKYREYDNQPIEKDWKLCPE